MKKLTDSHKKWFVIRSKGEEKKRIKIYKKKKNKNSGVFCFVHAPENFSLLKDKDRDKLIRFLSKVRGACKRNSRVKIDFSHTKRISAEATLLVYAEIHRVISCIDGLELRGVSPKNWTVAQAMKKIGLLKILKTTLKFSREANSRIVAHWHSAYGEDVNGEKSDDILTTYEGVIAESLSSDLYTKITEAMTNVNHHAYIEERQDGLSYPDNRKPWWMFSQELDGYLTVAFCDLGIGIPRSLPIKKPGLWKRIKSLNSVTNDSTAITEAIRDSQTRTGEINRGKGLKQIVDTVRSFETGIVRVHSNKGCYTSEMGNVNQSDYNESIMGTVISWRVPLPIDRSEA